MAKSLSSGHRKSAVTAKYPSRPRPRKEAPKSKEQQRYYQAGSDTQSLPGGALPPPYKNTYLEKFGAPPPRKKTVSKAAVAPTANSAAQPSLSVPLLPGRRHNGHRHGPGGPPAHTPAQAWTDETTGELYLYQEGQWSRLPASSNNGALTFAIDGPNNLLKADHYLSPSLSPPRPSSPRALLVLPLSQSRILPCCPVLTMPRQTAPLLPPKRQTATAPVLQKWYQHPRLSPRPVCRFSLVAT